MSRRIRARGAPSRWARRHSSSRVASRVRRLATPVRPSSRARRASSAFAASTSAVRAATSRSSSAFWCSSRRTRTRWNRGPARAKTSTPEAAEPDRLVEPGLDHEGEGRSLLVPEAVVVGGDDVEAVAARGAASCSTRSAASPRPPSPRRTPRAGSGSGRRPVRPGSARCSGPRGSASRGAAAAGSSSRGSSPSTRTSSIATGGRTSFVGKVPGVDPDHAPDGREPDRSVAPPPPGGRAAVALGAPHPVGRARRPRSRAAPACRRPPRRAGAWRRGRSPGWSSSRRSPGRPRRSGGSRRRRGPASA